MPKSAQGTWVGTQAQPVFQTYQTAGMLQPAPPPTSGVTPPPAATTPPVIAPIPPIDLGGIDFGGGGAFQSPSSAALVPEVASIGMDDSRTRLANAVLGATLGKNLVRRGKF